ncbi:Rieske (2Fe-2S) protein [Propioniciclava coleopterorum]|uniref:Rieske (2Fe-2S) protein n=1 Tax=Propioniciclava coleopterorum TaxID=2714937 RepID=A0A6G7Y7W4_9ACTN|nr:Rieske (2Fe-2S) protein [Propioniciclava coleopterorum]QIK72984.1 Rieske (2Fe-2S) protein [Propioniciclava coleopterorum]
MTSDRRTFLTSAGLTAVAVGTAAATAGCSAPSASPGAPPAGNALAVPADSIPVGGGKILDNASFVVTQPTAGEYKAFNKMCTHQGCPVAAIEGAEIVCRCHGARFSIADGSVTNGPATKPLKPAKAVLDGADVKVSSA